MAVSPAHLVPGIEPSADPMLQARLFSYSDSQRHRLGTNYQQIPVNTPLHVYSPFQRDGPFTVHSNYGSDPNYPSPLRPLTYKPVDEHPAHERWVGSAVNALQPVVDDDFVQATGLWEVLGRTEGQQENFVYNVSSHLFAAKKEVRERTYKMFAKVDENLGASIEEASERAAKVAEVERGDQILDKLTARLV